MLKYSDFENIKSLSNFELGDEKNINMGQNSFLISHNNEFYCGFLLSIRRWQIPMGFILC